MVIALKLIFWISSFLVVYPYVIYPIILLLSIHARSLWRPDGNLSPGRLPSSTAAAESITMIISAYNEEAVISQKIENALSLVYSGDFEIIAISDGSTDSTVQKIKNFTDQYPQVKLVELDEQVGKSMGLNIAIPQAAGEIIVFTDANAMYDKHAISKLAEPFSDENVGYTVGSALYSDYDDAAVNDSEGLYWRFELFIKNLESRFCSVVGGDGAIYAIRKSLYTKLSSIDISDFVNPLQIIAAGYKGRFVPDALSYEGGTEKFSDEFRRKRRIVNRSWGAVRRHFGIFKLRRHAQFIFMLASHKVIRWWSFLLVLISLCSSFLIFYLSFSQLYGFLFCLIAATLLIAFVGWRLDRAGTNIPRPVYILYYFYLVSIAGMLGIVDDIRGFNYATWKPLR